MNEPTNPTPPEPKVQVTARRLSGEVIAMFSDHCSGKHRITSVELESLISGYVAAAVEAARAEAQTHRDAGAKVLDDLRRWLSNGACLYATDRTKPCLIIDSEGKTDGNLTIDGELLAQRDQLQAELSRVREDLLDYHKACTALDKFTSWEGEDNSERIRTVAKMLATERAEHAETKRERDRYFTTLAGALHQGLFDKVTCKELREPGEKLQAQLDQARAEIVELENVWQLRYAASRASTEHAESSLAALEMKYNELIYAVGTKWEGETRHQTALKYILRAETPPGGPAQDAHHTTD